MTDEKITENDATATTIATWLFDKIQYLAPQHYHQSQAVMFIKNTYGDEWTYQNQNGNLAIETAILDEFRKLRESDPNIQWHQGSLSWQRVPDERLKYILERKEMAKQRKEERKTRNP